MIIRRRRTRNFTIVENEVFNDERLSLEAMGLLAWLRSRPDDWSLSVEHLRSRFKVGRDSMHKLVRELVEAGWVTRERKRDETTKAFIGIEYVVLDEAAPPNSGVSDQKPCPENQDVAQGCEGALFPVCAEPRPDLPRTANQDDYIRTELYQEQTHTPLPPQQRAEEGVCASPSVLGCNIVVAEPEKPRARFADLAALWPWEDGESRVQAEGRFERLGQDERRHVLAAAPAYLAARERAKRKRVHLKTFIEELLWQDFPADSTVQPAPKRVFIAVGTPEFAAWDRAYRAAGRPGMPRASSHEGRQGWWRPTLFPAQDWSYQREVAATKVRDGPSAA